MLNFKRKDLIKFKSAWNFLYTELLILFIADILLLNMPLTNILGYEYSAVNALLIAFLSGFYVIRLLKKELPKEKENLPGFLKKVMRSNLFFLTLPFVLSFVAAFFTRNCSFFQGILFYLVITVPSFITGSALGLLAYFITPRFPGMVFIAVFVLGVFAPLTDIYFNPQIYFFNPFIGYYPGTIYDESLAVGWKLISYRIINVIFFTSIAYLTLKFLAGKKQYSLRIVFVVVSSIVIAVAIFIMLESPLGFTTTHSRLKHELSGNLETKHFLIYFDKKISRKLIENIALHHEFYFEEVTRYLNSQPKGKITSFLFFDNKQKQLLLGSAAADVAMPWKNEIFINYENYDQTLKHEIAHCVSSEFGVTPFRVAYGFNPSMIEGIASASDDKHDFNTVHYMAALAYNNQYRLSIETLFSGLNFFGQSSGLSYTYAGSFIKYLIDKYGIERFKKIYQGDEFREVYNKSIEDLAKEYYFFISSLNLAYRKVYEANYYFGRPTIFKKICARYLAKKIEDAWEMYNDGDYYRAKDLFGELLDYSDSYQALSGYITCLKKINETSMALVILDQNIRKYESSAYYYNLELIKGDLSAFNKEFRSASQTYRDLQNQNPSKEYQYLSTFRGRIVNDTVKISHYLSGSDFDKYDILKKLNADSVFSSTVPIMISLSEKMNENYYSFIHYFENRLSAYDLMSSFALLKLSMYSLKNNDYPNARIFAITALNYKDDRDFTDILTENLKKVNWFANFAGEEKFSFRWLN